MHTCSIALFLERYSYFLFTDFSVPPSLFSLVIVVWFNGVWWLPSPQLPWLPPCQQGRLAPPFISDEFDWLIVFWLFSQREPSQDVPALVTRPSVAPSPVRSKTRGVSHQSGHSSDRSTGATQTHTGGATACTVSGTNMGLILNYAWGIGAHRWHSVH